MDALPDLSQLSPEEKDRLIQQLWHENRSLKQSTDTHPILAKRRAGVLLHITSLPVTPGNGDLGDQAYYFIDFLKECGFSVWQMLPIHPTHRLPLGYPHRDFLSPYQVQCVHAGNPALINLEWLVRKGWLREMEPSSSEMEAVIEYRHKCLKQSYRNFVKTECEAFLEFKEKNAFWLEDYALFCALKRHYGYNPWWDWHNESLRHYEPTAIAEAHKFFKKSIDFYCFQQFVFFEQWRELQEYVHSQGIYLYGDMPFFVAEDSVEMWAQRENFLVNEQGRAEWLAGVPPEEDYFGKQGGQCWGNPLYNWEVMQANDFIWWFERFKTLGQLFDVVRLTHFRGFSKCWAIPSINGERHDPKNGHWETVPGEVLFEKLPEWQAKAKIPLLIAENIVAQTPQAEEANELLERCGFSQIKILQLAFDLDLGNVHLPHHHALSNVVYTGTQDSAPALEWLKSFANSEKEARRNYMHRYLGFRTDSKSTEIELLKALIKMLWASNSKLAMIPMQDLLVLSGKENRINTPGRSRHSNWRWRFQWDQVLSEKKERMKESLKVYERD